VTDDTIRPSNRVGLCQEFRTFYDDQHNKLDIEFGGAQNLWENPEFYYYSGVIPYNYEYSGDMHLITGSYPVAPLNGDTFLVMPTGLTTDFIGQRFSIDPEEAYIFSAYAVVMDPLVSGAIPLSIDFLDSYQTVLESYPNLTATIPPGEWTRAAVAIRPRVDLITDRPSISEQTDYVFHTGITTPADAESMFVRFQGTTGTEYGIDCLQLERGHDLTPYTRLPRGEDLTIEYETSDEKFYEVTDLSVHPVRNAQVNGFFSITPVPAHQWDPTAPANATTLSDDWPYGRLEVLPWAKTEGYNKYNRVVDWRKERLAPIKHVAQKPTVAYPSELRITPSTVVARQDSEGEFFSVEVFDQNGNPYSFEAVEATIIDSTGEFPGYLARKEWSYWVQLGQSVVAPLNEAGTQTFLWIPPESEDIEYRGDKPSINTGQAWGYVDVPYEIYGPNHGSPAMINSRGETVTYTVDPHTGYYYGVYEGQHTYFELNDYPLPSTTEVAIDQTGGYSNVLEESFELPLQDMQYHVDYEYGVITIAGEWTTSAKISYESRKIWRDPVYPRRLYIDSDLINAVTGDISVQYDALINLQVAALSPTGQPYEVPRWITVEAVAQHKYRS
jgi:hypothetical protein